jgi:hypothetical protein
MKLEKHDGELYIKDERKLVVFLYDEDVPDNIDKEKFNVIVVFNRRKIMTKKTKELKKGDKIKVEFGYPDNFITVTLIDDIKCSGNAWEINTKECGKIYSFSGEEIEELV